MQPRRTASAVHTACRTLPMKKEHILVIRFSALGDVAMMVPVVWQLAQRYPDVRITVLSRPFARQLFCDLAPNVNFMAADVKTDYHGVKGLNRLYRRLTAKQFTAVADLHSVLRSDYLRMRFCLGHYRVEHIRKNRHDRRRLVAPEGKKELVQLSSPFEKYCEVLERLGYPVGEITFRSIFEGSEHSEHSERSENSETSAPPRGNLNLLPQAIGQKRRGEQWIGVAPFSAHKGKDYPIEKMRQVVEMLAERYPRARFFLFGRGQRETMVFDQWTAELRRCINVAQHTETMYEELILMSHLDVMISMDSANMHLASLTATPVVSIWGATHPLAGFMGWKQRPENAVQADLPCRPCSIYGQKSCRRGDYACLNTISAAAVAERVQAVIDSAE